MEPRIKREWLMAKWEELSEKVEPRVKWEELKVEEEAEQRVKEEGLKEEEAKESRGLVSLRSVTREVEPTTIEGLWQTGRGTEEWLDQLDTEVWKGLFYGTSYQNLVCKYYV